MVRAAAVVSTLTLLATAFLTASLLILRPPRADYARWALAATVIVAADVLILLSLRPGAGRAAHGGGAISAVAVALLGSWTIYGTLSDAHFEGYALVLGAMLVAQGVLTTWLFYCGAVDVRAGAPVPKSL